MTDASRNITQISSDPMTWVDQYGDYLLQYALSFVRDKHIAEDIVQETFLAALRAQKTFAGQSSLKTWLGGILKHKAIDYYRKAHKNYQLGEDENSGLLEDGFVRNGRWAGFWQAGMEPKQWQFDPGHNAEQNAFHVVFDKCMSHLPPRMASAFERREIEQQDTKTICAALGISESNLGVLLHRARLHLRRCIELNWLNKSKRGEHSEGGSSETVAPAG